MITIIKKVNGNEYTITGEKEFHHQRHWRLKEPIIVKKDNKVVTDHHFRKTVIAHVVSADLEKL